MNEEKIRFQMRVSQDTERKVQAAMPLANCRSKNEFVEKALRFYCDYLTTQDTLEFLPPIYLDALRGTIRDTERHICSLLFKLAVETDMVMNVLAAGMEIPEDQLRSLRGRCVKNVKEVRGSISLDKAVKYQNGE